MPCPTSVWLNLAKSPYHHETGTQMLPRHRRAGPVLLDLLHRDGLVEDIWLGLHPREFGLLWRLAETPHRRVTRRELMADVWRLDHVPETNSLEVHVSRLRAKLAVSQAAWVVETDPAGGYRLARKACRKALDSTAPFGDDGGHYRHYESPLHAAE